MAAASSALPSIAAPEIQEGVRQERLLVAQKIALGFGITLVLMATVGLLGWTATTMLTARLDAMYSSNLTGAVQLADAEGALWQLRYGFPQFLVLAEEDRRRIVSEEPRWVAVIERNLQQYAANPRTPAEQQVLREWTDIFQKYRDARPRWFTLQSEGRLEEAAEWRAQTTTPYGAGSVDALSRLIALQREVASAQYSDALAQAQTVRTVIIILLVLALISSVVVGIVLARSVARPVHGLTRSLQESSSELVRGIDQIRTAVLQQSSGASQQSAAIVQTSAAVNEVATSAQQAVETGNRVSAAARTADEAATEGATLVEDITEGMVATRERVQSIAENMLALAHSSQEIGTIISTVADLADQANLLALNAAIEATRAGEQGKGFAVVAGEIRRLAEQSKDATVQVRTILTDIQHAANAAVLATEQGTRQVDAGVELINRAGNTIADLTNASKQAVVSAEQIAAVVNEHTVGMDQIASAMTSLKQVTQDSLAATTATQQTAEDLARLAERMNRMVARYQI